MNAHVDLPEPEAVASRSDGLDRMLELLGSVWSRRRLIGKIAALSAALGFLIWLVLPRHYTAEAMIINTFSRSAPATSTGVTIDAAAVIESRARFLRSLPIARMVVTELGLEREYGLGFLGRIAALFRNPRADYMVNAAALKLDRDLSVKSDPRSQIINVAFSAKSPQAAARIANGFAQAYLRGRSIQLLQEQVAAAQGSVDDAMRTMGEAHPNVTRAKATLEYAMSRLRLEQAGDPDQPPLVASDHLIEAQPVNIPNGLGLLSWVGLGALLGLLLGVGAMVLQELMIRGLRNAADVEDQTGLPCLGQLPAPRTDEASTAVSPAERAACQLLNARLPTDRRPSVVLLAPTLPGEHVDRLAAGLAQAMSSRQESVLLIDLASDAKSGTPRLEDILTDEGRIPEALSPRPGTKTIGTALSPDDMVHLADTPRFDRFIEEARARFPAVIIATPPVLEQPTAALIGRRADQALLAVKWRVTPVNAVNEALAAMRGIKSNVSGVVLVDAPLHSPSTNLLLGWRRLLASDFSLETLRSPLRRLLGQLTVWRRGKLDALRKSSSTP